MNKIKVASRNSKYKETVASARLQKLRDMKKISDLEDALLTRKRGKRDLKEVAHDNVKILDELTHTLIKKLDLLSRRGSTLVPLPGLSTSYS